MRTSNIIGIAASALLLASCEFLDVVPAKRADFEDAMKNKDAVESWIYGRGYHEIQWQNPFYYWTIEQTTDDFVLPEGQAQDEAREKNYLMSHGMITSGNVPDTWWALYGAIGYINLFEQQLEEQNPSFLTEADKSLYRAHAKFLKAYYYLRVLQKFGPMAIVESYADPSTDKSSFPGRSHFDYCVEYICRLLDDACADGGLPVANYNEQSGYGKGNQVICAALKSRLRLLAASPLWNGSFPFSQWQNTNFETPGYGKELVSYSFDIEKWRKAKTAARDAIDIAEANGRHLVTMSEMETMAASDKISTTNAAYWIPGLDTSTPEGVEFYKRVLLMRYAMASDETMGNHELIWTVLGKGQWYLTTKSHVWGSLPRRIIKKNDGNWQYCYSHINPTLETVEAFYTKNGKLPKDDPDFTPQSDWLKSANLERPEVINLNVNREPRFYAWINFDGCDIGPYLVAGKPLRLDLRSYEACGYSPDYAQGDLPQTGYLNNKFIAPAERYDYDGSYTDFDYPTPLIRLNEMYLNLAEACAELYMNGDGSELQNALDAVNVIRERAGIPLLTAADCGDGEGQMSIRDWVRNERRIELYAEGYRYYDLRRWCIAAKHLSAGCRTGLDCFVSKRVNPTIEEFNTRVKVDGNYQWFDRMYLLPLAADEVYSNPQMVQAPGY
jgi:hypothetical protein